MAFKEHMLAATPKNHKWQLRNLQAGQKAYIPAARFETDAVLKTVNGVKAVRTGRSTASKQSEVLILLISLEERFPTLSHQRPKMSQSESEPGATKIL
jgi:hypothetical protein